MTADSPVRTLAGEQIPGTESVRVDKLDEGDTILTPGGLRRAYVEQVDTDDRLTTVIRVRYLDGMPGRLSIGRSVRVPRYLPLDDLTTPSLVRELLDIKMAGARGELTTERRHTRLGEVVAELRRRGVLD